MKKNPFKVVSEWLGIVTLALFLLVVVVVAVGIVWSMAQEDIHLLWQVPLLVGAFFGAIWLGSWIGDKIENQWRKWSADWDRKHGIE